MSKFNFFHVIYDEEDNVIDVEVEVEYTTFEQDVDDINILSIRRDDMEYTVNNHQQKEIESLAWLKADQDYQECREEAYLRRKEDKKYEH